MSESLYRPVLVMIFYNTLHNIQDDESWLEELTIQEKKPVAARSREEQELPTDAVEARKEKIRQDELCYRCSAVAHN